MTYSLYCRKAAEAFNEGRINEEVYDAMLMNAYCFVDEDEDDSDEPLTFDWYFEAVRGAYQDCGPAAAEAELSNYTNDLTADQIAEIQAWIDSKRTKEE